MKKKARITAIIAAAAVASALAGCGSSTGTAGTSSSQQASSAPEETQTGETSASADCFGRRFHYRIGRHNNCGLSGPGLAH